MGLTGVEIEELTKLLVGTLAADDLATIVYSSTGDRLYDEYVAKDLPLKRTIETLLIALEKSGVTKLFLGEVHLRRPHRPDVRDAIVRLCPEAVSSYQSNGTVSVQNAGQPQSEAPTSAIAPGLQRNVRPHLTKVDLRTWLEKLVEIEGRVCRIEIDNNSLGTGFLVGPDAVLTNWHVVEASKSSGRIGDIICRFDYLRLSNGARQPGVAVRLQDQEPLLDSSPYAPAEKTNSPDSPPPTAEQLDYALLRLSLPAGEHAIGDVRRGWIALPSASLLLPVGAPILIVQHPDGAPMKLAMDTDAVIDRNAGGTRIRYRTNTDPGSSGSPCFTMDWDLVALHHFGDPAWQAPTFNQGVPIDLIRQRITQQGRGAALGA